MTIQNRDIIPRKIHVSNINENTDEYHLYLALVKHFDDTIEQYYQWRRKRKGDHFKVTTNILFPTEEEAEKALKSDSLIVDGNVLVFTPAYTNFVKRKHDTARALYLPQDVAEKDLFEKFANYNPINVIIISRGSNGVNGRYAYIVFDSKLNRDMAVVENSNFYINGKQCRLMSSKRDFDE